MSFDDYNNLEKIILQMRKELNGLDDKINYNLQCVKEAEVYASLLINSEPEDFKIMVLLQEDPLSSDIFLVLIFSFQLL